MSETNKKTSATPPSVPPLTVTSPAFAPGGWIPDCYSGYGEDRSPALQIAGLAPDTVSLILTLDDLGHPIIPGYNHWVAWNLPPLEQIPEALPKGAEVRQPFRMNQGLAYGRHCYRGPKPPFNGNHTYRFTVYALDTLLTVGLDSDKGTVLRAAEGHILQTGALLANYQRRHA